MKRKKTISDILHFFVHNSFLVTIAVMGLVHLTLLCIMLHAGVGPLVAFNILSCIIYIFCTLLCKYGHIKPVYISILLEVSVYSIVSVYYIGWNGGSACFLFSIVPIIIYFGSYLYKGNQRWIIVGILALDLAIYSFLYLYFVDVKPVYEITAGESAVLILFSSFVMVFSTIFYNTIYIYSSEFTMNNLEEKNEKLSVDAQEDALTSLLNRRGFLPIVESLMQSETHKHFCIAFCDIDNFKRVNDSFGHDGGDEVLRHISMILKKEMTGCEICRWGGEEFVILMRDYDFDVAKKKMEYIRNCVETMPTVFFNKRIATTITIGIEEYKDIYDEPEKVIKVADKRMYYGKQHGKNIVIYEDKE